MKTSMPLVLVVALVVVGGLFSATIFGLIDIKPDAQTSATATGLILGHVVTTHKDAAGNVLSYRQSDNLILNGGENCVTKLLFGNGSAGSLTGTNVCTGTRQNGYRFIAIGNNTSILALTDTNTRLGSELNVSSYGSNVASGDTLLRQTATMTGTAFTNSSGSTNASVVMSAIFKNKNTASTGSSVIVTESGLYNNTYTTVTAAGFQNLMNQDGLFARQTFSGITMAPADTLTVQWTMTAGGTGTFN